MMLKKALIALAIVLVCIPAGVFCTGVIVEVWRREHGAPRSMEMGDIVGVWLGGASIGLVVGILLAVWSVRRMR